LVATTEVYPRSSRTCDIWPSGSSSARAPCRPGIVQTWIMAGGAVSGSSAPALSALAGAIASIQLRIMGRLTGSRAARGRLSPAAARLSAAARIAVWGVTGFSGVIAVLITVLIFGPSAGPGPRWR